MVPPSHIGLMAASFGSHGKNRSVFPHVFFKQLLGEAAWHGGANVRGSEGFVFGMAGINGKSKVHVQNYAEHPDIHLDFDRSLQCFSIFLNMILAGTSCLQLLHY